MTRKQVLNKEVHNQLTQSPPLDKGPVKILQVGDGNFIRAFIDWLIYELNQKTSFNGKVAVVQALPEDETVPKLERQDGLYTLMLQGKENKKTVDERYIIDSIDRGINPYTNWADLLKLVEEEQVEFLFSNTTEAGIQYKQEDYLPNKSPVSYPGKVTALLYHRYLHFNGDQDKGWIVIPCELIENNGDELKRICLEIAGDWELPGSFIQWMLEACTFCNTLVDRIVPGYPKNEDEKVFEQLGYRDELLTVAEPYHLFVIEGPDEVETKLPFKEAGLNVQFDKVKPYRELKVKLLNAPHTILASIGIVAGIDTVRDGMEDSSLFSFINSALVKEIGETIETTEQTEVSAYIEQIYDRFANPFLDHKLTSISLNSFSKFKTRVLPIISDYREKYNKNPKRLLFSFASLLIYFKGVKGNAGYEIKDNAETIHKFQVFYDNFDGSKEMLVDFIKSIFQEDYLVNDSDMDDVYDEIADDFFLIDKEGIQAALIKVESEE